MRATPRRALARLADPLTLWARFRCALASRSRSRRSCRGLVIFSPVERVISDSIPASTPTTESVEAWWVTLVSTRIDTNQRPAASRDTVNVDGSAPSSGSGRDHTMFSGAPIFASVNSPLRQRNPDRVYSADWRDFLRDLKRGYFSRASKKLPNDPL